jgi:glycosyltransferase involved in cell wall biosynthesis
MRILFLNPSFPPDYTGGAEVSLIHTAQGFVNQAAICRVLSLYNRLAQDVDEWYHVGNLPVHRVRYRLKLPMQEVFDPRTYRAVLREIATFQPNLVHIHNASGASLAPYLACRRAGAPVVNTLHDLWLLCPNNMRYREDGSFCDPRCFPNGCGRCFRRYQYWAPVPQRRRLFQWLTRHVKLFISPSQALIDRHVEAGYARKRFRLAPYGFHEPEAIAPRHPAVLRILSTAHQQHIVVFAGGGNVNKGTQVVIEALPHILGKIAGFRLVVAGGGEQNMLSRLRAFGPAVQVLGNVPFTDMRALFAAAELSLAPSVWHENSPVVIYENFQMGTPVVGSHFGGTPELIDEDRTGYTFPVGDAKAMAAKILAHFAKTPQERRQMRQNCLRVVRGRLSLESHLDALKQIYAEALA